MNRPWMPLYIADYLADTAHLNAAQSGAYLHLIMHYWQTGSLPADDQALSRIARMTGAEWRRGRKTISSFFLDGWRHKRIDAELAHAEQVSSKRRAAAEQRHSKSDANASPNAEQMDTHARTCPPASPSQPQSQDKNSSLRSEAPRAKRGSRLPADWQLTEDNIAYAIEKGVTTSRMTVEAEKFRNYWTSKSGQAATKTDWDATWRNWILTAVEQAGTTNGQRPHGAKQSAGADFFAGIAEVARDIDRDNPVAREPDDAIPLGRFNIDG